MKKTFFISLLFIALIFLPGAALFPGQNAKPIDLYLFWGDGCPHCAAEEKYLETLKKDYPSLQVHDFEVWNNKANQVLMTDVGKKLDIQVAGVPLTVIGDQYIVGYLNDETTGANIKEKVDYCLNNPCLDVVGEILKPTDNKTPEPATASAVSAVKEDSGGLPEVLKLPIFGEIKIKNVSLPFLTLAIGLLDGFNPCAMWTLVFLITLLLNMQNRKRMWILGGAFIFVSGSVYFLLMAAWLNFILFVGFISWVRLIIGLVAIGSGIYNLKEYFANKDATCIVEKSEEKKRTFEKLRQATQNKNFWLALGGIVLLAAAVNLVELVCSADLPAIYTQVLSLSHLPVWQYYLYLCGYVFFYMLDDMAVFVIAMITLRLTGASNKYTRASYLIGGALMLLLGLLLIFKPKWLMFG